MDVSYLAEQRDHLIEELNRLQYNFEPVSILQIIELERIMETLDQLTTESSNIEGFCDVTSCESRRGAAFSHPERDAS